MDKICALLGGVQVETASDKQQKLYNLAERATSLVLDQITNPLEVQATILKYLRQAADLEGA